MKTKTKYVVVASTTEGEAVIKGMEIEGDRESLQSIFDTVATAGIVRDLSKAGKNVVDARIVELQFLELPNE